LCGVVTGVEVDIGIAPLLLSVGCWPLPWPRSSNGGPPSPVTGWMTPRWRPPFDATPPLASEPIAASVKGVSQDVSQARKCEMCTGTVRETVRI